MNLKRPQFFFFLIIYLSNFYSFLIYSNDIEKNDQIVQPLASLIFHMQEYQSFLDPDQLKEELMIFSDDEVDSLWMKVQCGFDQISSDSLRSIHLWKFENARQGYQKVQQLISVGDFEKAKISLDVVDHLLRNLWIETIEIGAIPNLTAVSTLRIKSDPHLDQNPYIPREAKKKIAPYLIPLNHPMRSVLDGIFLQSRATINHKTFEKAGFETLATGPRSYIHVAKHPDMQGYLVKAYLDTELQKKRHKESWKWLVSRCEGVEKVHAIIKKRQIKHFVAASKWIYCLPPEPSPPLDHLHTRHLALLLVTDMNLSGSRENYKAWKTVITEEHLDELYAIISRARGSSYRPDNIAYTKNKKFAFIDTEYPSQKPDYKSIRNYLNPQMLHYWDGLVRNGGY